MNKRQYPHSPGMRGKCGELSDISTITPTIGTAAPGNRRSIYADTPFPGAAGPSKVITVIHSFHKLEDDMKDKIKVTTSYKEVRIGNTIYRVTSVFSGEKDLGKSLEQLAVRRAMEDLASAPAY